MSLWSDITFGIEFEAGANAEVYQKAVNGASGLNLRRPVLNYEFYGRLSQPLQTALDEGKVWWFGTDGGGIEVKSPVSLDCDWPEIFSMLRHLQQSGCVHEDGRSGMHVHFGTGNLNTEQKFKLLLGWFTMENVLFRLVAPYRKGSGWCPGLRNNYTKEGLLAAWRSACPVRWSEMVSTATRRAFGPNGGWPTFENRIHHGCLDPEYTFGWVEFIRVLMDHWMNDMSDPEQYVNRHMHTRIATRLAFLQAVAADKLPPYLHEAVIGNISARYTRYNRK